MSLGPVSVGGGRGGELATATIAEFLESFYGLY